MTRRQHAHAISRLAAAELAGRRRRRELAGVVLLIDEGLHADAEATAHAVGLIEVVETARDRHLATLDADDGLRALLVPWKEVALLLDEM
jgi:hypothetical protein